ncbi:hypothetical protein, partial [Pseudomonas sp.]|uniref:hypothetical protein n=1 Tax=Pseudomonas sp. TaxID=306 RepID=UPI0028B0B8A7
AFSGFALSTIHIEDSSMTYATYHYASTYAWRFSQFRSGQPAASVRSIPGGNAADHHSSISRTPR